MEPQAEQAEQQQQFYLDEKIDEETLIEGDGDDEHLNNRGTTSEPKMEDLKTKVVFPSRVDSYPIIGYVWRNKKMKIEEGRKIVYVVISVATGMHQDYHFLFAEYLVNYGSAHNQPVIALTYDYRGMGESRDADKPTLKCDFFDWGNDYAGALDFVKFYHQDNFPIQQPMEVCSVGNSIGAYLLMVTPQDVAPIVQRGFLLSAFNGYVGFMDPFKSKKYFKHNLSTRLFFASVPVLTPFYGYFPSRTVWNSMEDVPTLVAKQWKHFFESPKFMVYRNSNTEVLPQTLNHTTILAWVFEDDVFTNKLSTEKFNCKFVNRCKEYYTETVERPLMKGKSPPKSLPIGHVGFFSKYTRNFSDLWRDASEFIIFGNRTRKDTVKYFSSDNPRISKL